MDARAASGLPARLEAIGLPETPSGLRPQPGPPHTVSQQHRSRLARPLSAASDRHRQRRDGGAAGTAPGPLPMEWRMSMEASRSVLSRDWALWNSTTAAAAILPLSHRPRPRPPTPETHTRKTRPRVPTRRPSRLPSQSTPGVVVSLPSGWTRSVPQAAYELPIAISRPSEETKPKLVPTTPKETKYSRKAVWMFV